MSTKEPIEDMIRKSIERFRRKMQEAADTLAQDTARIMDQAEELLLGEEKKVSELTNKLAVAERTEHMRASEIQGSRRREEKLEETCSTLRQRNAFLESQLSLGKEFFTQMDKGADSYERQQRGEPAFVQSAAPVRGEMGDSIVEDLAANAAAVEGDPIHPASMDQLSEGMRLLLGGQSTPKEEQARSIGKTTFEVDELERRLKNPPRALEVSVS